MRRRSFRTLTVGFLGIAALVLAARLPSRVLSAWSDTRHADSGFPSLVVHSDRRDLGSVEQGQVLRPTFRVTNKGGRRLVLHDEGRPCCGEPDESRRIVVPPGDSASLELEIDTARWCGRMEHTAHYTTNDPARPELVLTVTAQVESPPEDCRPTLAP